jgi:hypothetical protein
VAKKRAKKKAKAAKPAKKAKAEEGGEGDLQVVARLRKISVGDKTASVGFALDVRRLAPKRARALELADEVLTNARLNVLIEPLDPEDEVEGQMSIPGTEDADGEPVESVADCNTLSIGTERIGGTLSFRLDDVDRDGLLAFANKAVRLTLSRVGDRGTSGEDDAEGEMLDDRDPAGGDDKAGA